MKQKIKWALREIYKAFISHRTNSPYISGDSIARIADLTVTKKNLNDLSLINDIQSSNSIFIEGHNLVEFMYKYRALLKNKVVISGNSDTNFNTPVDGADDLKLLLCQNSTIPNTAKFKTLPIGIENLRLGRSGFKRLHQPPKSFDIVDKVLVPPMSPTNEVRAEVLKAVTSHDELFDVAPKLLPTKEYFGLVRKYKFVFVCEGNGYDTHRMWEVLYQNSFPVVLMSDWVATLEWLELPILVVESISDVTKGLLADFAGEHSDFNSMQLPQLWIPFWKNFLDVTTKNGSL